MDFDDKGRARISIMLSKSNARRVLHRSKHEGISYTKAVNDILSSSSKRLMSHDQCQKAINLLTDIQKQSAKFSELSLTSANIMLAILGRLKDKGLDTESKQLLKKNRRVLVKILSFNQNRSKSSADITSYFNQQLKI